MLYKYVLSFLGITIKERIIKITANIISFTPPVITQLSPMLIKDTEKYATAPIITYGRKHKKNTRFESISIFLGQ
jgi:hypothetical protein